MCWAALPKLEEWSLPSDGENAALPIFSKMSAGITIIHQGKGTRGSAKPSPVTLNRDAICDLVEFTPTVMKRGQDR